ncbi:DUF2235 domain-containing protein [Salmonella enterica]|nr:type VI secretion protein [Salmonella enterica subsp. enterica serovar Typhimurium var. 5- str. CFSAN004345]MDJ6365244.1 DUF2235 domain-containing protein [Salmonella enterica]
MHSQTEGIPEELITIHYDYIRSKHLIANTEYSVLLTPENYNRLFPATLPVVEPPDNPAKKREIVLTIGVFFDGTGNNLLNTNLRMQKCNPENYGLDARTLTEFNQRCIKKTGFDGTEAGSYLNYYTNIYWLNKLYHKEPELKDGVKNIQRDIYIEGIGTENNKADSLWGMGLGNNDTGVIAKTDRAMIQLRRVLTEVVGALRGKDITIASLQFDVFGFSRGAAAARHFTNRVFEQDPVLVRTITTAFQPVEYQGKPAGEVQFLGLFDTVTAVGGMLDGLDPHDGNNLAVKIGLPPGVAKQVFHLTAMHECRYNFCLNSIKAQWPELSLPGAHADIGGGYNPQEEEYLFLSRPAVETVLADVPTEATGVYQKAVQQAETLPYYFALAPMLPSGLMKVETNTDEKVSPDHLGNAKKRVAAAVTFQRIVSNDWSKVALRVMYEVAKEAGVVFDAMQENNDYSWPTELDAICQKALSQAKNVFNGANSLQFSSDELNTIGKYIHCSANWNAVDYHLKNNISSAVSSSETFSFVNRPDENWTRTVYDMAGNSQK